MTYTTITSLGTKRERQLLAQDIQRALKDLPDVKVTIMHHGREMLVDVVHPLLSASWWASLGDRGHLIAWHGAKRDLAFVPGAWGDAVNKFHMRKATSFCPSPNDTISGLVKGFQAVIDGSAFAP